MNVARRLLLGLVLVVWGGGTLPARELPRNMVTFGINSASILILFPEGSAGLSLGYGRFLNEKVSLGIDLGTLSRVMRYVEARGDWYPGSGIFHMGLGFGAFGFVGDLAYLFPDSPRLFAFAGVGWRVDIGKQDGWILLPGIKARLPLDRSDWTMMPVLPEFSVRLGYGF